MKLTRKISIALVLVMLLTLTLAVIPASAASQPEMLYLTPNANWKTQGARFAAYFFGNGETWVSMTDSNGDGVYEVKVPTAKVYPNVIFCRMNPGNSTNGWGSNQKWNQTADLVIPTSGTNHYIVKEGTWDKGGGTWSTFGSTCQHTNLGAAATCTTPQVCLDCKDPVVSALGHNYDTAHKCGRCGVQAPFTVAGSGAHLGTEWDPGNTANDMTYADGVYTKVYENVAADSYKLKVVRDHDWGTAYPSADKPYTVAEDGSTVTVTLKNTTVDIVITPPAHVHDFSIPATCLKGQSCSCGEVMEGSEPADHTFADGLCTVCGTLDLDDTVTVYFENNWKWSEIHVYYWHGENNNTWPGAAIGESIGKSAEGNDIYAIKLPVGVDAFIINGIKDDGSGATDQTPDIKEFASCNIYSMFYDESAPEGQKQTVKVGTYHVYDNACDADCNTCGAERVAPHSYTYPCDAHCNLCYELTNENASHTIVHVEAVKGADCQSTGNLEYWTCSDCGACWLDEDLTLITNRMSIVTYGDHSYTYPCDARCVVCGEITNEDAAHTIVHVDAVEATCQSNGNVEYWYCSDCGSAWLDEARTLVTNLRSVVTFKDHEYFYPCDAHCMLCGELTNKEASHNATHVEAVEATCQKPGNLEFWTCSDCGGMWLDEELIRNTNRFNVITYAEHEYFYPCDAHCMLCGELTNNEASHTIVHVDAVEATCQANGNVEYWYCSDCGAAWLDEALTMVTNLRRVVTFKDHEYTYPCDAHCKLCGELTNKEASHNATHVEAVEATCQKPGNLEFWTCSDCGGMWLDEELIRNTNRFNVITYAEHEYLYPCDAHCILCGELTNKDAAHTIVHVEAVEATCQANGNVEYWYCSDCGSAWLDEARTLVTNLRSVVTISNHVFACHETCENCDAVNENPHHILTYVEAKVPANCSETGWEEYWTCSYCNGCFGDAEGSYQVNPAWIMYTGEHVRPEGSIACAVVPCAICGEDSYGDPCDRGDAPNCQDAPCINCGETCFGWGCTYNTGDEEVPTPLCQPGTCIYCGTYYEKIYECENGGWATCCEGECAYGCGKKYPATTPHDIEDPCVGGLCEICWEEIAPAHEYFYPCDAHCMNCGELTNVNVSHNVTHVEAVEATCQKPGNLEFWTCSDCGGMWLDEELIRNTNRFNVITYAEHEYFYPCDAHCMLCGELTNNEASHTIVHVEAVKAADCQSTGNLEYWTCSDCGSAWLDEALTMVTNRRSVVTVGDHEYFYECDAHCMVCGELTNEEAAHSIKHVEAVAATCFKTGNIEYWTCEHCGACWDNENATGMPLNAMMVKTYLDHEYMDAICVHCGSQDPTTKAPDYIFTTDSLDPIEQGDVKKGDTLKVGTDDYFTIIFGDKSKVDASKATFEDGFVAAQRLHFNGNTKVESKNVSRSIMFTTEGPTTIKIWWKAGKDGRNMEIYTFDGSAITAVYSSSTETTEGSLYITTFEITKAGTYYLGHAGGTNYIYKVTLTKHDHEHNYQPKVVAPTCEDAGYTVNVCSTCGFVGEKTNEVEALGHDMITDAAKAPTCTETGLTEGSHCSRCDKKVAQETVDALGHDMVTDAAKAPTCTETGLTEGSHCSRCDEKVAQEEIPALGHTYFYNACLVCGGANPNFIANYLLAGNNKVIVNEYHLVGDGQNGNHTFPYEFVLLTVLEDGKYTITSDKLVGVTIFTTEVNSEGADFTAGTGASWAKYVFGEAELKAGTYFVGLVYMDGVGEYDVAVTKHVHSFADATCTAPKTCACGATEGTALGHDMVTDAAKAPTCTESGLTEGSHCSRCDHKVAQEEIPATGHTFEEGKCECGAEDPNYTPDQPADDEPVKEPNFFEKIWIAIVGFFTMIGNFFANLFKK